METAAFYCMYIIVATWLIDVAAAAGGALPNCMPNRVFKDSAAHLLAANRGSRGECMFEWGAVEGVVEIPVAAEVMWTPLCWGLAQGGARPGTLRCGGAWPRLGRVEVRVGSSCWAATKKEGGRGEGPGASGPGPWLLLSLEHERVRVCAAAERCCMWQG